MLNKSRGDYRLVVLAIATATFFSGFLFATDTAVAQQASGGLFLNPGGELDGPARGTAAAPDFQNAPNIARSRLVDVDFSILGGDATPASDPAEWDTGTMVSLNLFDDANFIAILDRIDRNPSGTYTWVGHLASDPLSSAQFVVNNGITVGTIHTAKAVYEVRPAGASHIVHEVLWGLFPPNLDPIPVYEEPGDEGAAPDVVAGDDGSRLDVLILWTPLARTNAGGTAAIEAIADAAISDTNSAYTASGINTTTRLVHKQEVTYTESGACGDPNGVFGCALTALENTSDGLMDIAHTLRDTHGADLVALLIHDAAFCGLASLMTTESAAFEDDAFSVTAHNCAVGNHSFAHELGHNQGMHHDRYVTTDINPSDQGVFSYSHGYTHLDLSADQAADAPVVGDAADSWRTVMAYGNECFANFNPFSCTRLGRFSNPDLNYLGNPTGVSSASADSADNRMTLNNTRDTVANFRTEIPDNPPPKPTGLTVTVMSSGQVALAWTDPGPEEDRFKIYRGTNGGSLTNIGTRGKNKPSYNDNTVSQGNDYCYRVRGHNSAGNGPYSDTVCTRVSKPSKPTNLALDFGSIDVTWDDNSINESHFRLYRRLNGGAWSELTRPDRDVDSYSDNSVATGPNEYCYRVRAKNGMGYSNYSNVECLRYSKPAKPTGLGLTVISTTRVQVDWNDVAVNEKNYKIVRNVNGGSFSTIATRPAGTESYSDNGVNNPNTYCYRVRASNPLGNSSYSTTECIKVGKPPRPDNMQVSSPSANQVDTTWDDNSNSETRFRLYRRINGGAWAFLANVVPNTEAYTDNTTTGGNQYCYRVRAQNAIGYSNYSNVRCITP